MASSAADALTIWLEVAMTVGWIFG